MNEEIKKSLETVRPMLQADGGDVQFVAFNPTSGEVRVELSGMCLGCPMAQITLQNFVLEQLQKDVPIVKTIKAV
ncbi:MAG: NifU family protein [bacterium]